jgi:hypothetical protein
MKLFCSIILTLPSPHSVEKLTGEAQLGPYLEKLVGQAASSKGSKTVQKNYKDRDIGTIAMMMTNALRK